MNEAKKRRVAAGRSLMAVASVSSHKRLETFLTALMTVVTVAKGELRSFTFQTALSQWKVYQKILLLYLQIIRSLIRDLTWFARGKSFVGTFVTLIVRVRINIFVINRRDKYTNILCSITVAKP